MITRYKATFSDGSVVVRNSKRDYSHAWRMTYLRDGVTYSKMGFARSEDLAKRAKSSDSPRIYDSGQYKWVAYPEWIISFEVVPVNNLNKEPSP